MKKTRNLAVLLAEGETDVAAGRMRPARAALKDVRRAAKVPLTLRKP